MSGSPHLFKFTGTLNSEDIKLNKNYLWDTLEIKWDKVKLTFNDNKVNYHNWSQSKCEIK